MRFLVFAFIFVGLIHLANLFYAPVIKNNMLEGKMIQLSQEHRLKADMYMMKELTSFIDDNNIELDPKQISIQHPSTKSVVIKAKYDVYRKFWFLEKSYAFEPSSEASDHRVIPDFTKY